MTKGRDNSANLIAEIDTYYSSKIEEHGETPQGVDWNGEAGQFLRFEQLCKIISSTENISVNDLGSGYGALLSYLNDRYSGVTYYGYDVSEKMVQAARRRYANVPNVSFEMASHPLHSADYGIASGIFNVKQSRSNVEWTNYVKSALDHLNDTSKAGFAFNCLTSYSDKHKMRDHLYYADPAELFDFCKRTYSRQVALLHDYDLYEFTILVRKKS